jgi:alkanesulfonate monooxygenase SsuD/methylene tetrahydromethanopterin reductase-like flavin-dependent oxidoreductase (luciferase family)
MKLGVILPFQQPQWTKRCVDEMLETARVAQEAGFEVIEIGQHYLAEPYSFLQTTPTMARVAAEVPGMELRAMYLMPLNHPMELAENVATLDILTDGHISVGAILGYREIENRGFGFPASERFGRFMEGFTILRQLLRHEEVNFIGKHYRIEGIRMTVPTVQQPHPPLLIGGNVDPAVIRAARIGDGWVVSTRATTTTLEGQAKLYRSALAEAGKSSNIVVFREAFVADTHERAIEACRPFLGAKYESVARWGHQNVLPATDNLAVPFDQLVRNRFIIGNPEECGRQLLWYRDELGAACVSIRCQWPGIDFKTGLESIRRFGRDVLPWIKS